MKPHVFPITRVNKKKHRQISHDMWLYEFMSCATNYVFSLLSSLFFFLPLCVNKRKWFWTIFQYVCNRVLFAPNNGRVSIDPNIYSWLRFHFNGSQKKNLLLFISHVIFQQFYRKWEIARFSFSFGVKWFYMRREIDNVSS